MLVKFHHLGDSSTQGVHIGTPNGTIPNTSGQDALAKSPASTLGFRLPAVARFTPHTKMCLDSVYQLWYDTN